MNSDPTKWVTALKDYVPLFQTLVWAALIVGGLIVFRKELRKVLDILYSRLQTGSEFEVAGVFKIGAALRELEYVQPGQPSQESTPIQGELKTTEQRIKHRHDIERHNREVFLAHVIEPSSKRGQKFDIFIYLIRHKAPNLSDVDYAEFFLGRYWGNRVFRIENSGKLIGLSTSAYGSVLCTCRVVFKDGYETMLDRYIDFEMSRAFE